MANIRIWEDFYINNDAVERFTIEHKWPKVRIKIYMRSEIIVMTAVHEDHDKNIQNKFHIIERLTTWSSNPIDNSSFDIRVESRWN